MCVICIMTIVVMSFSHVDKSNSSDEKALNNIGYCIGGPYCVEQLN